MIGHLSVYWRNKFLAELEHGAVTHTRILALPGGSQELVRALRDLVNSAATWEELHDQTQRFVAAAREGREHFERDVLDIFRISYDSDERSVLTQAVSLYIAEQQRLGRHKVAGASEEAFVTVRVNTRENIETAEGVLRRL
jgi:hypothetical protein